MPAEEVTVLGGLRAFIAGSTDPALAGASILLAYPEALPDQTKTIVRLEVNEGRQKDWVGMAGPNSSTPGKVDKSRQHAYSVRIEVWARRAAGKSEAEVAVAAATAVRQRLDRDRVTLLKDTGLKYLQAGRIRLLPADANFPDFFKVALWLSAYKDENWTEDP